jgi:thiamine-phosphate pyrophosphorylase
MRARQPLPRIWLVTDERQGDALLPAVARLPVGAGILFRHYSLAEDERRALFREVVALARRRRIPVLLAGEASRALAWGADGWHGGGRGSGFHSAPVHDLREIRAAERGGAAFLFLSPVYPTRSHPGAPHLGESRFANLVRRARLPVMALGGVNPGNAARLMRLGAYGWAGIDAWTVDRSEAQ